MLISWGKVKTLCEQGANVAELMEVGYTMVTLSTGAKRREPVMGGRYVDGAPFGNSITQAESPIDLQIGDEIALLQPDGEPFLVIRSGKQVWPAEEIPFEEPEPKPARRGAAVPRQKKAK